MSAQVTEAHRELARRIMFEFTQAGTATASDVRMAAQIIADSEAKAVAEWKDSVHLKGEAIDSLLLECGRLRAELANERARLDWLEDHGWITGEPCDRAAIDAAMKEYGK